MQYHSFPLFKKPINAYLLIATTALWLTLTANLTFFLQVTSIYPLTENLGFVLSVGALLFAIMWLLFTLLSYKYTLKTVLIFMLLAASITGYFTDVYGTVYDTHMLQNALQTDTAEARDLMNIKFFARFILLGIIPSLLIAKMTIRFPIFKISLLQRVASLLASLTLVGVALAMFSQQYASFFREHKPVRFYTNPVTPIYSVGKLVSTEYDKLTRPTETIMHATDAKQLSTVAERKPKLVVMVVGETARADHVSFNGYQRDTFPQLAKIDGLTNFSNVTACGTSTAYSLPCMFNYQGEKEYDVDLANYHENVLDTLNSVGVHLLWRDNNSDPKGVMNKLPSEMFEDYKSSKQNTDCQNTYDECRDTGMLVGLDTKIAQMDNDDVLIILHQMGNHGPAYYKRYNDEFAKFTPVCTTNELASCEQQAIINAYDNALLATDDFLAKTIDWLTTKQKQYDVAMLYVSDHGESLGENGIYLHGMPKSFAPDSQLQVPTFLWLGNNSPFKAIPADSTLNHDAITPTLLKLFDIKTTANTGQAFVQ